MGQLCFWQHLQATSSTYELQASDEGDTITVRQTETNGIGSDSATSQPVVAIVT